MNVEVLKRVLKEAQRDERHNTNAETRYWCSQYKAIAEKAITALAAQLEPVQWQKIECPICGDMAIATDIPLTQRTWRGLTDKEFEEIIMSAPNATVPVFLWQLIQDRLKEKNT